MILFILIMCSTLSAQDLTEKYNSYENRYEYYNSYGDLIGYKKWNSYSSEWEYFVVDNKKRSSYIDPIDNEQVNRTMGIKQNNYDNNVNSVHQKIRNISSLFEYFIVDKNKFEKSKYKNQILDLYESFENRVKAVDNANMDFTKSSAGREILIYLDPIETKLQNVKTYFDREKFVNVPPPKISENWENTDLKIEGTNILLGGYESSGILEYEWDDTTDKFELTNQLNINSKLYFQQNQYAFKRGNNDWLYAKWTFDKVDETNKRYHFYDNYGQKMVVDLRQKSITWYRNRGKNDVFQNIIKYSNMTKNNSVKPE